MVRYRPVINFIIILLEPFWYESALHSFSLITVGFVTFWRKDIGAKTTHKKLMKLTTGVHFYPEQSFSTIFRSYFLEKVLLRDCP